uniref:Uncharacterized protein n=1 Tax=Picea glauca TaxID=3330 RepID=A0A101LV45_PICGL|nr:hypothetical protein ABT39_MTgene2030 [Picea glauca]
MRRYAGNPYARKGLIYSIAEIDHADGRGILCCMWRDGTIHSVEMHRVRRS